MFGILNEWKEKRLKAEQEKKLKQSLAQKCADMGGQYLSHQEDETEYTIVTINGETIKVRKEKITIEGLTDLNSKTDKNRP